MEQSVLDSIAWARNHLRAAEDAYKKGEVDEAKKELGEAKKEIENAEGCME